LPRSAAMLCQGHRTWDFHSYMLQTHLSKFSSCMIRSKLPTSSILQ
jgi:hypothetical protein